MSTRTRAILRLASICLIGSVAGSAQAQWNRPTAPVATPPVSLAAPDQVLAIDVNPAALGFVNTWELAYVHARGRGDDPWMGRGDAVFFGTPLFLGLAAGASLQSVRPIGGDDPASRGIGSFALAFAPTRQVAIGTSVRYFRSQEGLVDGHTGVDFSVAWRPSSHLAFALLGHDLNALFDLTAAAAEIPSTFAFASAFRPFGTRAFTMEAAGAVDSEGALGARGMLEVEVPMFGRAHAVLELNDAGDRRDRQDLRVLAGLALDWGRLSLGGGAFLGTSTEGPGHYFHARIGGQIREGVPIRPYLADLEVRGSVDSRKILGLVQDLDRALHEDRVAGVLLRLRSTGIGQAYAQEIRILVQALEEAGKPVVCHLDAASGGEFYACAAASRTLIDPAGGVRLSGPSLDVVLLGELLQRIGLRADFVRIGDYKSAPEQLTNTESSEPAVEQREALLDDVYRRLLADFQRDFGLEPEEARRWIDQGPYAAPEALATGLVKAAADEQVLGPQLVEAFGRALPRRDKPPAVVPRAWGKPSRIGVVVVDGTLVDGDNVDIPFLDVHLSGARTVVRAIERQARDPSIAAIVLRVDSPGGSALASDQIWRAVRRARRHKPVVASFGAVAASGGYYVASAADEIWTDPSTVTGSIGIFFGKVDVADLADRVGIHVEQMSRGRHAGAESIWRPFTPEEREMLARKIRIWYRMFLDRVAEGRGMTADAVDEVARGRVWSGEQAVRIGLADRLGGFASALARARELGELGPDAEVTVAPFRPETLLEYVLGRGSKGSGGAQGGGMPAIPASLRHAIGMAATFGHARPGVPLALLPARIEIE